MRGTAGFPVRLRYGKVGRVRFISHRDLARAFERAFRIVELPLAFTEGFSPRPKVSFGLALPVGAESCAEYLDLELTEAVDLEAIVPALNAALPEGIAVLAAAELDDRAPSLQEVVTLTTWSVDVAGVESEELAEAAAKALAAEALVGTRRRKGVDTVDDLRPCVAGIRVAGPSDTGGVLLAMDLLTAPRSVRPGEVFAALASGFLDPSGPANDVNIRSVVRTHQWIERDGARHEPLDADTRPRAQEARV